MVPVMHNLASAAEDDVRAIASYIASLMPPVQPDREKRIEELITTLQSDPAAVNAESKSQDPALRVGAQIYDGACASCHDRGRQLASSGDALYLPLSTVLYLPTPRNLVRVVVEGITPPDGERGRWMPGFEAAFTDQQLAALAAYLRARYTDRPAWTNIEDEVKKARKQPHG